jgi:hypothetical protein
MSAECMCMFRAAAMARTAIKVVSLTIGENVSEKSTPARGLNSWATKRALNQWTEPFGLAFTLKTHLYPMALRPSCRFPMRNVPLLCFRRKFLPYGLAQSGGILGAHGMRDVNKHGDV